MTRHRDTCGRAAAELERAVRDRRLDLVSAETREHLASCPQCRAGLMLLSGVGLAQDQGLKLDVDCDACLADLPAFIDEERRDPARAATLYPHVWWHLWTCAECAETYALTSELVSDPRVPAVRAPVPAASADHSISSLLRRVRLDRSALNVAFPASVGSLGSARGSRGKDIVVYESDDDDPTPRQISIAISQESSTTCSVRVQVIPPVAGWVLLVCGLLERRAAFAPDGIAVIDSLASTMVSDRDGPELEISILSDDGK